MQVDVEKTLNLSVFKRMFGKCLTKLPENKSCWTFENNQIVVDLSLAKEIEAVAGALRCEGKGLPERVLVFRGDDNELHAVRNACSHGKRRLDPVPGGGTVQCCSMGKSTYSYEGKHLNGELQNLTVYAVDVSDGKAFINVQ